MDLLIPLLLEMLLYCRPYDGHMVRIFCEHYLKPLGAWCDVYGNWNLRIGTEPILWSCHTDTVHSKDRYQLVRYREDCGEIDLPHTSRSKCLGADDTVGVALMVMLARAGKAGYYLFHHAEEAGCIGSREIRDHHADWLKENFRVAIALDRKGTKDVITHQRSERGCSDAFAKALSTGLGLDYAPCDGGLYTDTASYIGSIPECTNLSIGYHAAHTSSEWIDTDHVQALGASLLALDTAALPVERDPSIRSYIDTERRHVWPMNAWQYVSRGWDDGLIYREEQAYSERLIDTVTCHYCSIPMVQEDIPGDPCRWFWCKQCGDVVQEH